MMLSDSGFYLLLRQHSEYLDIPVRILIADIQPELVESVRACQLCAQPYVSLFGLAELGAVRLLYKRAGHCKGLFPKNPADELASGGDIAPLVASAKLQNAALVLIQPKEVVALKELVAELCKRHSLTGFRAESLLHRILCHHVVYGYMLSNIADEVNERIVLHPVVIVHKFRLVRSVAVKIQETAQLRLDAGHVVPKGFLVKQISLRRLHGRVSNHSRGTTHQRNRPMPALLEVLKYHHAYQVTYMQRVCRWVYSHISSLRSFHKFLFRPGHNILDHASPFEFFYKVLHL